MSSSLTVNLSLCDVQWSLVLNVRAKSWNKEHVEDVCPCVQCCDILLDLTERTDVRQKCHRHLNKCENDDEVWGSWVFATGVKWFNITTLTPQQPPLFFPFLLFIASLCSADAPDCRCLQLSVIFSSLFILCHSCVLSFHS